MNKGEPEIVFEDDSLLVINKPSGWISNDASTTKDQPVVQSWVAENFKFQISNDKLFRNGLVHRLDKETSGIILIAKTAKVFEGLQAQFKERKVQKTYIALVHGRVKGEKGRIDAPVGRLPWRKDRFGVLPGGRDAVTDYTILSNYKSKSMEDLTLLELAPKTGRTHQIRIHLKHIGHPIVSDKFYAGRKTARNDRKWCPRLFLHAKLISFTHPENGNSVEYSAPLTDDLQGVLDNLEN